MANRTGKIIRVLAIILMGLTATMNLLGGIGTTCAAFSNNIGYRMAFKELMDYRWLYQALVVTTILIALAGIWATVQLVRGGPRVYRDVLVILLIGTVLAGVHYFASLTLRGKAAPANVKFYLNIFTLAVFVLFRASRIWDKTNFSSPGGKTEVHTATGLTAIISGGLLLTVFQWAGPSHTFFNENWTYVFEKPLVIAGAALVVLGAGLLGHVFWEVIARQVPQPVLRPLESE
jgi:hypothetical protein